MVSAGSSFLGVLEFFRCSQVFSRQVASVGSSVSVFSSFHEPSGVSGLEFLGFGRLAADMDERSSRTFIWSILGVWRQI